ncbi:AIG2-like protein C [Glycine max]|nr:AIG2-like protein C [Glycine max]
MVPPANGGVETEQSGEKGLQNLTKIRKEVKHIPCIDVRLQRRMLHFAAVTNPNGNHEWQRWVSFMIATSSSFFSRDSTLLNVGAPETFNRRKGSRLIVRANAVMLLGISGVELDILDEFKDVEYTRTDVEVSLKDKSERLQVCAYVWSNPNDPNLYAEWDFEVSNHVIFLISICSSQNQYNSHCFKKNNELFYIFMMINLIMNCSVLKQQLG